MKTIIGGIVILLVLVAIGCQPEEPTHINQTAEGCAQATGAKCYGH